MCLKKEGPNAECPVAEVCVVRRGKLACDVFKGRTAVGLATLSALCVCRNVCTHIPTLPWLGPDTQVVNKRSASLH